MKMLKKIKYGLDCECMFTICRCNNNQALVRYCFAVSTNQGQLHGLWTKYIILATNTSGVYNMWVLFIVITNPCGATWDFCCFSCVIFVYFFSCVEFTNACLSSCYLFVCWLLKVRLCIWFWVYASWLNCRSWRFGFFFEKRTRLSRDFLWGTLLSKLQLGMFKKLASMTVIYFFLTSFYIFQCLSLAFIFCWKCTPFMQSMFFQSCMQRCSTVFPVLFTHMLWGFALALIGGSVTHHSVSSGVGYVCICLVPFMPMVLPLIHFICFKI